MVKISMVKKSEPIVQLEHRFHTQFNGGRRGWWNQEVCHQWEEVCNGSYELGNAAPIRLVLPIEVEYQGNGDEHSSDVVGSNHLKTGK